MTEPPDKPPIDDLPGLFDEEAVSEDKTRVTASPLGAGAGALGRRDRAALIVLAGGVVGEVHALDLDATILGRGQDADVRIDDSGISRRHAKITRGADGRFTVQDLGSTNGTAIGDTDLTGPQALTDGDRIRLGRTTVLKFTVHDELERSFHRQMYESAVRDPLTAAFNRKYLTDRLRTELSYARRHGKSLSLLMLDIDHFKRVNDTLGHLSGDDALRSLTTLLVHLVRAEDVVARYGGEEFVILARGIDAPGTMVLAERVRKAVESMLVASEAGSFRFTVSIGVAFTPDGAAFPTPEDMVAAADEHLYAAKAGGRNQVVM